ncbi:CBS domain-containing protein [Desulfonispora thiosulfatigenes DSM 11270]|uniref:CBS domain-containing protein n=1 Tax=Desulfonispora thiosulfatigenes DSM 11270 TaxID=656914 RepID=A0A1W1UDB0_DESTI|nr:CBS domain-containing protein [Desulfonispora thiosulfatigenes]SMB79086.1 CBS domain-containing protein [Desulfonispora thiosulfatigenes DSM 11270]
MKVKDIMQTNVITINTETQIKEIAKTLVENNISGVFVVDSSNILVGVVSEGDLLHKETNPRAPGAFGLLGAIIYYSGVKQYESDLKKLIALKASEIMTPKIIEISQDAEIEEAASLMINKKIKRLPVMENGKIIGVVTRRDVIKTLMQD